MVGRVFKSAVVLVTATGLTACAVDREPIAPAELREIVTATLNQRYATQAPITREIDLYEAMARAIKYNLDHHVRMMELALATEELDLSRYDLLPDVVARAGWTTRSNEPGASSRSLLSGQESLEPSQSTEETTVTAELEAAFSVLDFGLSYLRMRQRADDRLIAAETRRRVVNRIVEDVRTAYWRAVSAERLLSELRDLQGSVEQALTDSRTLAARKRVSPLSQSTYQRELILIKERIAELQTELSTAKSQLATLMNLAPGQDFALALPDRGRAPLAIEATREDMMAAAFENRPEIREAAYRVRINNDEDLAAILDVMPNVNVFAGLRYDSNDFLFNNSFADVGLRASWNLMRAVALPQTLARNEAREHLLKTQVAATAVAVMSQVDVANIRFAHLKRELDVARERWEVQREILTQIEKGRRAGAVSEQTLLRERMNTLVTEVEYDVAYADMENAYANVFASIGVDPIGLEATGFEDVDILADMLRMLWERRRETAFARPAEEQLSRNVDPERLRALTDSVRTLFKGDDALEEEWDDLSRAVRASLGSAPADAEPQAQAPRDGATL